MIGGFYGWIGENIIIIGIHKICNLLDYFAIIELCRN